MESANSLVTLPSFQPATFSIPGTAQGGLNYACQGEVGGTAGAKSDAYATSSKTGRRLLQTTDPPTSGKAAAAAPLRDRGDAISAADQTEWQQEPRGRRCQPN